jgi:hypothetical protein
MDLKTEVRVVTVAGFSPFTVASISAVGPSHSRMQWVK